MRLTHHFDLPVGVADAWRTLRDVRVIAACMPGATLDEVVGDTFRGRVTIKVGPIRMSYVGEAWFAELDEDGRCAVIEARGRESRGSGGASATVSVQLTGDDVSSSADLVTDLDITGRAAQLGSSMIEEVSDRILGQFVEQLAARLAGVPGQDADSDAAGVGRRDSLNLGQVAWEPVAKRVLPVAVGFLVGVVVLRRWTTWSTTSSSMGFTC